MIQIKHIFFDLDHTLWDHDRNAKETIRELLDSHGLSNEKGIHIDPFFETYKEINLNLWNLYRYDKIGFEELRERRFREIFTHYEVHDPATVNSFADKFLETCPNKQGLMDKAMETLTLLHADYTLHIITNGFASIQDVKMNSSGIRHFFATITTSESAGVKKPHPAIFQHALRSASATAIESMYVGDNLDADVKGGLNAGMHTVFFNPENRENPSKATSIISLGEIPKLLVTRG